MAKEAEKNMQDVKRHVVGDKKWHLFLELFYEVWNAWNSSDLWQESAFRYETYSHQIFRKARKKTIHAFYVGWLKMGSL